MKELYVIRHGIAEDAGDDGRDETRALTRKGRDRVRGVARFLKGQGACPDLVLSSPLLRARETAEIIREVCMVRSDTEVTDLLRPGATYDTLIDYLNSLDEESIAVVGHEPFLSSFVSYCLSRSKMPFVRMKKAGVAAISYEEPLEPGSCELAWLAAPAQMLRDE